jgi:DNA-binding XRE family transcriptional regulator
MNGALTAEIEVGEDGPGALYRFFAPDGSLLYVGVTGSLRRRFVQHARSARWWQSGMRRTVAFYATETDALAAETRAILNEGPRFNLKVTGGHRPHQRRQPARPPARAPLPRRLQMGTTIRCLREKGNLTRGQLAEATQTDEPTLSAIESELSGASMPTLNLIARSLGVPVAAIMRYRDEEDAPAEPEDSADAEVVAA